MKRFILLGLFTVAFCSPFGFIENEFHSLVNKFSSKAAYGYGVTVDQYINPSSFSCMKQAGYSAAFIRVFQPNASGTVDYNGIQNIKNANSANLGVEIYVTPQPQSSKSSITQFDEAYQALIASGISVQAIWLQVTSPINWPNQITTNINFISSFLNRAKQYNLYLGVYTNWYDWQQITGGYTGLSNIGNVRLWYWNAYGTGVTAASPIDFSDFRAFANFVNPVIKQYSLMANVCNAKVNQNIFSTTASKRAMAIAQKSDKIVVGTLSF